MVRHATVRKHKAVHRAAKRRPSTLAKVGTLLAAPVPDVELLIASMANPDSGIKFVLGIAKKAGRRVSEVQSVIFDKLKWTADAAKQWLTDQGFTAAGKDEGATFWRFRQQSPGKFKEFRTIVPGTHQNPQKWILPFRSYRKNYEDVGYLPLALEHDIGFAGDKTYHVVKQGQLAGQITFTHVDLGDRTNLFYKRSEAMVAIKQLARRQNPDVANSISSYQEHLETTTDPEFRSATPGEQAAAMTAQDLCENPACPDCGKPQEIRSFRWPGDSRIIGTQQHCPECGWRGPQVPTEVKPQGLQEKIQNPRHVLYQDIQWDVMWERDGQVGIRVTGGRETKVVPVSAVEWPSAEERMRSEHGDVVDRFAAVPREFRPNPSGDLGQDAFDAAKDFRLSGAYSETGVANARVAKYGFIKWYNDHTKQELKGKRKATLLKNWMEGWAAGKRMEKKQGNPELMGSGPMETRKLLLIDVKFAKSAEKLGRIIGVARAEGWSEVVEAAETKAKRLKIQPETLDRHAAKIVPWRNPESAAAELYEEFHGKPPGETLEIVTDKLEHEWLTQLGLLVELKVATLTNLEATLRFDKDAPNLCSSEDGRQLYIEGGDQKLDLKALKMDGEKWLKDSMVIGVCIEVTYQTEKGFQNFKLTDYYHHLGEETGVQPFLLYDPNNKLLSISGGQYHTKPEGICN